MCPGPTGPRSCRVGLATTLLDATATHTTHSSTHTHTKNYRLKSQILRTQTLHQLTNFLKKATTVRLHNNSFQEIRVPAAQNERNSNN